MAKIDILVASEATRHVYVSFCAEELEEHSEVGPNSALLPVQTGTVSSPSSKARMIHDLQSTKQAKLVARKAWNTNEPYKKKL